MVTVRDPDAVQVIRDFLEPLGFTVEVELEPDKSRQGAELPPVSAGQSLSRHAN